ncbi:hypothetical protein VC940_22495 [Citrobacter freundii]|nr:hypothetical protein [Citrobacter freundii]
MKPEIYSLADTALKYASWPLLFIIIILVFHEQIKAFINKIISANKVKLGTDGLTIEATDNKKLIDNEAEINDENGKLDPPPKAIEKELKNTYWYLSVTDLLKENKVLEAKKEFDDFIREQKDNIDYDREFAFYSFVVFQNTKDEKILSELLTNIKQSKEPSIKKEYVNAYIYCLELIHQFTKAINLLKSIISETEDIKINSSYTTLLSKIYLQNLETEKAEDEIVNLINTLSQHNIDEFEDELYLVYLQLAEIEKKKNDNINYALCLDKALEFKPSNESTLFSAAFQASQFNFLDSIAISNYSLLENLAPYNDAVANNLGVAANKLELKIIACDFYHKAKALNSSISFSNIGYKLLEAGCAKEAEALAREAISRPNADKNNYELLAKIKKETEEEYDKWQKHKEKSNEKQKFIRNYVGKKYNSKTHFPSGINWIDEKERNVNLLITGQNIEITWQDQIRSIKFYGTIKNATLKGIYISSPLQGKTLLGTSDKTTSTHCVGFYDDNTGNIIMLSTESDNDLKITLTKNDNV